MKYLKSVSLYTLAGVIGAGVNFLIMPVLSHYLSPTDYGLLSLFNTYVTILIPLISLLSNGILSVEYFKEKDKKVFASKFTSVQIVPVVTALFFSIIVWMFYSRSAHALELDGTARTWGFIMVFLGFSTVYSDLLLNLLVIEKKPLVFLVFSLVKVAIEVGLTIYFVIYQGFNWEGRMYAWLITSMLFFIIALWYFSRQGYLKGNFSWQFMKAGIVFGLPLILHTVGKFVINQSDRLFIAKMISLNEAGIYNIGYTVGMMIMIVVNAFFNFYTPFVLERLSDLNEEKKLQVVRMNYMYSGFIIVILVIITLLSPYFFRYFVDARYWDGVRYVFWIALGYVFWGGYMLFSLYINYYNKNKILGWLAVVNVVTNLLFNYFFIKWAGAIGAAYATALSFLIVFVIVAYQANKLVQLPWFSFKKIFTRYLVTR